MAFYNGHKVYHSVIALNEIEGGYKIIFRIADEIYYVSQCKQGGKITKPPNPTGISGTFNGWLLNGESVSFPFTPSESAVLIADITE